MPKTVSNRQLRRTVVAQQQVLDEGVAPAVRTLATAIKELGPQVTDCHARLDALDGFRRMTFLQRLRWILRGFDGT